MGALVRRPPGRSTPAPRGSSQRNVFAIGPRCSSPLRSTPHIRVERMRVADGRRPCYNDLAMRYGSSSPGPIRVAPHSNQYGSRAPFSSRSHEARFLLTCLSSLLFTRPFLPSLHTSFCLCASHLGAMEVRSNLYSPLRGFLPDEGSQDRASP